jgi:RNA recognition motif-containing protein
VEQQNKLFVGNVAYATDIQTLIDLFSQYGKIEDSYKPQGKGFAFITFSTSEEANAALEALNGTEVDGRELNISIAQPRQPRENKFGNNDRRGGNGGGFNRNRSFDRKDRY